jgi:hypothetical protein
MAARERAPATHVHRVAVEHHSDAVGSDDWSGEGRCARAK